MDSESESDGGMQINPTSIADFWDAGDDLESSDPDEHDIDIQSDMDTPLGGWTPQGHREITGDTGTCYTHQSSTITPPHPAVLARISDATESPHSPSPPTNPQIRKILPPRPRPPNNNLQPKRPRRHNASPNGIRERRAHALAPPR